MSDYPEVPRFSLLARALIFLGEVFIVAAILGGLIVIPGLAPAAFGFLVLFGMMVWARTGRGR